MQQTRDECKFIPICAEVGKGRLIQKIRLSYSLLHNLKNAHSSRLFLFRNEAQGYKRALSYSHNRCRFRVKNILMPDRERRQEEAIKTATRTRARREAIIALRYGLRFGTTSISTIQRAETAGIRIKREKRSILSYAEIKRQIAILISSEMKGR